MQTQLRRYARHIVLDGIGEAGQAKLLASSVLIIGAGGLGSAAIGHLAAAGIGRIGIVEPDRVELSNLQRQLLYETADIGRPKLEAASDRIHELAPECKLDLHSVRLTADNADTLINEYDIVLDGSDNFATRFAVAECCMRLKKALVTAAISGFSAQLSTFKPYLGAPHPCYRCLVPELPKRERSCEQEGIIGPLAGMMGSWQALEAVKELLDIGASLSGYLLVLDTLSAEIRKIALPRDPSCKFC